MAGHGFDPPAGTAVTLAPGLRRVLAPNPSAMTWRGTNTYLLGDPAGPVAVIDPGPDLPAHLRAILAAAPGGISHVLVTHAHVDHSALAGPLAAAAGAPVLAYGDAASGRSAVMARLAAEGLAGGGEGVDAGFAPDVRLADGEEVAGPGWRLTAIWTPGHMGNHLSFRWQEAAFCGDLVMGWASSLVSPPDGDVAAFRASCARLKALGASVLHPGHGAPIEDPAGRIDWLVAHRAGREAQIRAVLAQAPATLPQLTAALYAETPAHLHPAASRNVLAHLVDLHERRLIDASPRLSPDALFSATPP